MLCSAAGYTRKEGGLVACEAKDSYHTVSVRVWTGRVKRLGHGALRLRAPWHVFDMLPGLFLFSGLIKSKIALRDCSRRLPGLPTCLTPHTLSPTIRRRVPLSPPALAHHPAPPPPRRPSPRRPRQAVPAGCPLPAGVWLPGARGVACLPRRPSPRAPRGRPQATSRAEAPTSGEGGTAARGGIRLPAASRVSA